MSRRSRLYQSAFTVGSWTLLSRLTGFFRDIVIAALFGSGPIAEAFQVAFALPNLFRRLFAEGTINAAFVPIFSKSLSDKQEAAEFARNTFSWLTTALIVLTVAAQVAMPWFVLAIASGFRDDGRFDLAVDFGRICFPYILFIALASLLGGILNSFGRFAAAAAAPVLLNVILLGAMGIALASGIDPGPALAWGVPVAGIAQLALMWLACRRTGIRMALHVPRLTPKVRRLAVVAFPAVLAGGVVQVNILVGRQVASYFDGAIQWLAVADRLYQLPLGVVGIATGIVLLPELMKRLAEGDHEGSRDAFNRATEFSLMLTIPAAFALVVIPFPLVSVLFERGAFTSDDSHATAAALAVYGIGLPAFVLQKTLQPLYFSEEDTRTPFRYAVVAMAGQCHTCDRAHSPRRIPGGGGRHHLVVMAHGFPLVERAPPPGREGPGRPEIAFLHTTRPAGVGIHGGRRVRPGGTPAPLAHRGWHQIRRSCRHRFGRSCRLLWRRHCHGGNFPGGAPPGNPEPETAW